MTFYNENDPKAAAWLRELIKENLIAKGIVDERSITEIKPAELAGFTQCHFFAGIGGWSYALRLAGWPDEEPVWTGSCPCQPFSQAGQGKVDEDERHLWPAFRTLIAERKPSVVFGEQVASKDGRVWLAGVRADVEALGYVLGAADLCAAGISAPMVSQRLHWVAQANGPERRPSSKGRDVADGKNNGRKKAASGRAVCGENPSRLGAPDSNGRNAGREAAETLGHRSSADTASGADNARMATANDCHGHWWSGPLQVGRNCIEGEVERGGRKYRASWRIKPGLSLLADGIPGRVAQLCGFGNAIVPQLAAEFIQAYCETLTPT